MFLGNNMHSWANDPSMNQEWITFLIDSNIMAAVLIVNSVTVSLAMFGNMIMDKQSGKIKGLLVSPVKRFKIVLSYIISSWITAFLLTLFLLFLVQLYLVNNGGQWLSFENLTKTIGLILFNVFVSSSFCFLIVSFIKSTNAFSTVNSIVSTLIGFICGIYIPLAILPEFVQGLSKIIPFTYTTVLMRQVFTKQSMDLAFESSPPEVIESLSKFLGVQNIQVFGLEITPLLSIILLSVLSILFLIISFVILNKRKS
jgi:multidrug/hemolysin transport system permease protein